MRYSQLGLPEYGPARATARYPLFTPLIQTTTYLLMMEGEPVYTWELKNQLDNYVQFLPSGNLLTAIKTEDGPADRNAKGGHLQGLDWDGNLVW